MQRLSEEQKMVLLKNPNVLKITDSHVVYTPAFKVLAVERNAKGEPPSQIFLSNGIDPGFFKDPKYCDSCLKRWRSKYKSKGKYSLTEEARGRKINIQSDDSLDDMELDDLKAIILIQQDIISQIKKKKALIKKN
jgi:hypothetical protein